MQPQTFKYSILDAVPPIHAESSDVATDKVPSMPPCWRHAIFSDNLQPIATRGKKAGGTLLVDIGCSSNSPPLVITTRN